MPLDTAQKRFEPDAPFRYVGGDVSLDLVNTVDWTDRGLESDRLTSYSRLIEWARGAGVFGAAEERRIRQAAEDHPRRAATSFASALEARDVLHRIFLAVARDRVTENDLDAFNTLLAVATPQLRVVRKSGGQLEQGWAAFGESLDSIQWMAVWAAAELLFSSDVAKVRVCAGEDCGWLYVDRSRNGLRRWCEMEVCGTTAKNRRRAKAR
jgi:predicted RNA-binding Zn ribbon-like protein